MVLDPATAIACYVSMLGGFIMMLMSIGASVRYSVYGFRKEIVSQIANLWSTTAIIMVVLAGVVMISSMLGVLPLKIGGVAAEIAALIYMVRKTSELEELGWRTREKSAIY